MEECIKDANGVLPGKTIFFCSSMAHARRMETIFDALYPQYKGELAKVLVSDDPRVYGKGGLLDQFTNNDMPRVAISVDMLDTGIDIREIVNLVFARPVYSYTKFWQMIGRGTRLLEARKPKPWCTEKDRFLILDCWDNFEYFKLNPKGKEATAQIPLPVRFVGIRLDKIEMAMDTQNDAIAEKELQEVIAYTKRSIEARLSEQNKGAKLDEVIAKIVFIPIAGKLALMHKLGQEKEALALGYDMERTGLPLVEAYLEDVLFGSNSQKANLIISSNCKEIESIIIESMASFEQERHYLNISHEEIEQAYAKHQEEKTQMAHFLEQIKASVAQSKEEMEHYFGTLQKFANNQLDKLSYVVKRRISDDVSYEFSKNKKAPKEERIGSMIETAMKDGLVDLVRDYRYEFQKKMQSSLEYMDAQYGEFKSDTSAHHFDARAFCEEHLGSLLIFKNSTIVISGANDAIRKYGKNDLNMLSTALDTILATEFLHVKEMLEEKLHKINHVLLSSFVSLCEAPARIIEERFSTEEALLEKAMRQMKDATLNREARSLEIEEKVRVMGIVLNDLSATKESK